MEFEPHLPPQCPPADSQTCKLDNVYRLLKGENPQSSDWLSHAQLGKIKPTGADECRWASLSLMKNLVAVQKLKKLPNFRDTTHAAVLDIPDSSGAHKSQKNHIDFWVATGTDLVQCIKELKHVNDD